MSFDSILSPTAAPVLPVAIHKSDRPTSRQSRIDDSLGRLDGTAIGVNVMPWLPSTIVAIAFALGI